MIFTEAFALLGSLERNGALLEPGNFPQRYEALDALEFEVLQRVEDAPRPAHADAEMRILKLRSGDLKRKWENVDRDLFSALRQTLRNSAHPEKIFPRLLERYAGNPDATQNGSPGYDTLDAFLNGLLHPDPLPVETRELEAGMVYFQKTPARVILEMVKRARLGPGDAFYDLGSGLGQTVLLVRLLTGAKAVGVEFEPAYCAYAEKCAADLNLSRVEFIQADARALDYPGGVTYYLYTPFEGKMLESVLERMRDTARGKIRLFTFGPCTAEVSRRNWLRRISSGPTLGEFEGVA